MNYIYNWFKAKQINFLYISMINNNDNNTFKKKINIEGDGPSVKLDKDDKDDDFIASEHDMSNPITKFYIDTINSLEKIKDDVNKNISNVKKMYKIAIKYSKKQSKRSGTKIKNPSGFGKSSKIPPSLKILFDIKEDEISRPKLAGKLYEYIDKQNLKSDKNGRIMRVNTELATALKLSQDEIEKINISNNDKDKSGLNFYTAQKWIKRLYENENLEKTVKSKTDKLDKKEKIQETKSDSKQKIILNNITELKNKKQIKSNKFVKQNNDNFNDKLSDVNNNDNIIIVNKKSKLKSKGI